MCCCLTAAVAGLRALQPTSVREGVYTAAQAARGQAIFETRCTQCHDAARFTGEIFLENWAGQPLFALYHLMRTTMPEDTPGSLTPQQYADVLSFFLRLNAFPTGQNELAGADEGLKAVRIEKPE